MHFRCMKKCNMHFQMSRKEHNIPAQNAVSCFFPLGWNRFFPTCNILQPARCGSLDFVRAGPPTSALPSASTPASTASSKSQWALPELNRKLQISVGTAGLQPLHVGPFYIAPLGPPGKGKGRPTTSCAAFVCFQTIAYDVVLLLWDGGFVWSLTKYMSKYMPWNAMAGITRSKIISSKMLKVAIFLPCRIIIYSCEEPTFLNITCLSLSLCVPPCCLKDV